MNWRPAFFVAIGISALLWLALCWALGAMGGLL